MNSNKTGLQQIVLIAAAMMVGTAPAVAAELYISTLNGTVDTYSSTGTPIAVPLVSGLSGCYAVAASGSNVLVSTLTSPTAGLIDEYNASSGNPVSVPLVTGLNAPLGMTLSGNDLFVAQKNGVVGEFNASTGQPINATLVNLGNSPAPSVAVSGNFLFVPDQATGSIGQYDATTGMAINTSFITSVEPYAMTIAGNALFVTNGNTVGEYNLSNGQSINASLVTGLSSPFGIAVLGNDLYVTQSNGLVAEYDITTGLPINTMFITGLLGPAGIVVVTPEPASWSLLLIGAAILGARRWRRGGRQTI